MLLADRSMIPATVRELPMSERFSASQQTMFDQIDETTFWSIANTHRAERKRGASVAAAVKAAVTVLGQQFPTAPRQTMLVVTEAIIARAAPGPLEWFWD